MAVSQTGALVRLGGNSPNPDCSSVSKDGRVIKGPPNAFVKLLTSEMLVYRIGVSILSCQLLLPAEMNKSWANKL
jgi:hypothetical protein